jgi:hypothetical protein
MKALVVLNYLFILVQLFLSVSTTACTIFKHVVNMEVLAKEGEG